MDGVSYIPYSILYSIFYILYSIFYILYSIFYILYSIFYLLYLGSRYREFHIKSFRGGFFVGVCPSSSIYTLTSTNTYPGSNNVSCGYNVSPSLHYIYLSIYIYIYLYISISIWKLIAFFLGICCYYYYYN